MFRIKSFSWILIILAVVTVITGFYLFYRQTQDSMLANMHMNNTAVDMGIVYLPVTPKTAAYYSLEVDSGALVTQIIKGSLVDRAGIKVGDVVLSFNGVRVNENAPLLGMMQSCPVGEDITLEIWRNNSTNTVTLVHKQKSAAKSQLSNTTLSPFLIQE